MIRSRLHVASKGFALVEIVIALGIVVFCLLATLGLFSVGHLVSREASSDTSLAAAVSYISAKYQTDPTLSVRATSLPAKATWYFGHEGEFLDPQPATAANIQKLALYKCEVTDEEVPEAEIGSTMMTLKDGTRHSGLRRLTIAFTWPVTAAQPVRTFHAMHAVSY